ncbi:MAG TPA: hypothetical protein VIE65_18010 [Methylobacter sp.]|jgi:hypothetical protein
MKWILTEFKLPIDGQCCHVVFDHDDAGDTAVWWAQHKDGKWLGVDLPGNDVQELHGKAICWTPEPENPFATHQEV